MVKLLIGMTGSLEIMSMPSYLGAIKQHFPKIKIIMSYSATQFIPKLSFSMFADGIYTEEFPLGKENMCHMELARWADLFIVIPATAHVLSQAAHGICDTLLSTTILAYEKEIMFFPNMNSSLWRNKALQRNIACLRKDGHIIIDPLEKLAFEYASKELEINHVLPSVDSVLSILKLKTNIGVV